MGVTGLPWQPWKAPLGLWEVCAGTSARPWLEGSLLLVLGCPRGHMNPQPQARSPPECPQHNVVARGRAKL